MPASIEELPPHLLALVLSRLPRKQPVRLVCSAWRQALPPKVVRVAWGNNAAEHDVTAQLHQLHTRFPAATIEISTWTDLLRWLTLLLAQRSPLLTGCSMVLKVGVHDQPSEIQAALASLLTAGLGVAALLWGAPGQQHERVNFATQAACLTMVLQQAAVEGHTALDADWQALRPAAATLTHLDGMFTFPVAASRLTCLHQLQCLSLQGRDQPGAALPPDAELHLPHLRSLQGSGLVNLAACAALVRANPQLRAVRLNVQDLPATVHGKVAAAVGTLHALAVLCLSCDIQAADAAWFCPLVQLPQPSEMVVTLRGLHNSNLATKAAVLLRTPQARINSLQLSGEALHQALPSLHTLPRLLILSLERRGLQGPARFLHQQLQWPPFPQLQRLELSTDELVASCGAALIAAGPLLERALSALPHMCTLPFGLSNAAAPISTTSPSS